MAILWSKSTCGASYKVTNAGNSVRLYRNNVLHSQWNYKRPVSGHLWELFLLSTVCLKENISNVLVLGVGGGSVINLIHHYYPEARVDAVDYDQVHLMVAKKFFRLKANKCQFHCADAKQWLYGYKGAKYDLIIDDVFSESDNIPFRSIQHSNTWLKCLMKNTKKDGIIVFNFADKNEWSRSSKLWKKELSEFYIGMASHSRYENKIIHLSKINISSKNIKTTLKKYIHTCYIRYLSQGVYKYRTCQVK